MQFASKLKRTRWVFSLLGLIPELLMAALVAKYVNGGWMEFMLALVGLQAIYFAVWLKKSAVIWIIFLLGGRKQLASVFLDYLRSNQFPEPGGYEKSADSYFEAIAENEKLPIRTRLKAAAECGRSNYLDAALHMQESMRLDLAYEDAIAAYKSLFPPKAALAD